MKKVLLYIIAPVFTLVLAGTFIGCGDVKIDSGQLGGGSTSTGDLSGAAPSVNTDWHNSYLVGAHSGFLCTDCHISVARTSGTQSPFREISANQICANCHMGDYNRTSLFNHGVAKTGTYCNACHYSDSFRSHTRISHGQYHNYLSGSCLSCHTGKTPGSHYNDGRTSACEKCHQYPSWQSSSYNHTASSNCVSCHSDKTPGSHRNDGRTTTCENCHTYPNWSDATFSHSGVTSGCANCHSKHYSGYACESCHTSGISWDYSHRRVRNDGCLACHNGDGHGDGHSDGHGDDDD